MATYTVAAGITSVVLENTTPQTVAANNLGDTIYSNDAGSTLIGGTGNDTFIPGHGHDMITGGGGNDTFVFDFAPWNAGHITDFNVATDTLNLSGIFTAMGYTGTDPVADGYLSFTSDGAGDTLVSVKAPTDQWPSLVTTLDHVAPSSITPADYGYGSSSGSTGGTGSTGTTTPPSTETDTTATTYVASSTDKTIVLIGTTAQTVTGNDLGDTIISNNYGSTIIGGTGNDTIVAGTGADHLTGGGGSDTFVFNALPTKPGQITDFNPAADKLDLSGIFTAVGYTGANPAKSNWISFTSDHHGNTNVYINPHNGTGSHLITTLDHISPSQITTSDWMWHH
jgi:Ca2+-binding RTX toxin-like protein